MVINISPGSDGANQSRATSTFKTKKLPAHAPASLVAGPAGRPSLRSCSRYGIALLRNACGRQENTTRQQTAAVPKLMTETKELGTVYSFTFDLD